MTRKRTRVPHYPPMASLTPEEFVRFARPGLVFAAGDLRTYFALLGANETKCRVIYLDIYYKRPTTPGKHVSTVRYKFDECKRGLLATEPVARRFRILKESDNPTGMFSDFDVYHPSRRNFNDPRPNTSQYPDSSDQFIVEIRRILQLRNS